MKEIEQARRRFLKEGLALASLPLAGIPLALGQASQSSPSQLPPPNAPHASSDDKLKAYGERSRFVTSVRVEEPHGAMDHKSPFGLMIPIDTPLQDSLGIITPNSLFFVAGHDGFYVPDINPDEHRLMIHGMVDHPVMFTMEELKRLPSVSRTHYIECEGNDPQPHHKTVQQAAGRTSCAEWTGVQLSLLLKEAGLQSGASWVVAEAADDNRGTVSIPLAKAMDDCLVVYGQSGEPLRPQNGFPLRLIAPGLEGLNSVKWLRRIKVTNEFYMTYNNLNRFTSVDPKVVKNYVQGPKSVITSPSGGQQLPGAGHYEITGLAWSGGGAVSKVEISTDGGQSWKDAEIRSAVHRMAHTRFGMSWNWTGEEHVLMSRCTDEKGQIQPTQAEFDKMWNVEGVDEVHKNFILPWKLGRDGRVENGLS